MPNSPESPGQEQQDTPRTEYGPDWVGLDAHAMRVRSSAQRLRQREAAQREAARSAESLKRLEEYTRAEWVDEPHAPATLPRPGESHQKSRPERQTRPRPTPLIDRLHIQNMRSLTGYHEVPLAPLTLIYGPNSSGKSTILQGLKVFMGVVDAGRRDALRAWQSVFEGSSPRGLITYETPEPDDPEESHWRAPLGLGVAFRTRGGEPARAELGYEPNPYLPGDSHSSGIGMLDERELFRKQFGPADPDMGIDPSFFPESFGDDWLARYVVREKHPGGRWRKTERALDTELFAHPSRALKEDLFAIAFFLRYLGAHRGSPADAYVPVQGPFNDSRNPLDRIRRGFAATDRYGRLNQMMCQLEVPYEFEERLPTTQQVSEKPWVLKDLRSGAPVRLDQVGYGVSQLLPVIDVCVHARLQVICIEEPELHLHPRLQSRLGNLVATSVLGFGNQVILETHSESILLRVRRLIRRGKLLPDEVALLYVDNTDKGASVRRLRLGEQGELLDRWPTGFYDDRLEDVLGGWE